MARAVKCRRAAPVSGSQTGWASSAVRRGSAKAAEAPLLGADLPSVQTSEEYAVCKTLADDTAILLELCIRVVAGVATQVLPRPIAHRSRAQVLIGIKRIDGDAVSRNGAASSYLVKGSLRSGTLRHFRSLRRL